ncbi:MAG: hypothetical protein KDC53_10635, partial [Saprospiraceae bacterium]|nr:hypothetical protein [Saprospiraceae bacterium]
MSVLITVSTGCTSTGNKEDHEQNTNEKPDRNMGGLGMPRGLIKREEGLTEAYILYEEPNSSKTYLVNRKGEVVHEWKGNYECMMSYLTDSG